MSRAAWCGGWIALILGASVLGCRSPEAVTVPPDERFGHRPDAMDAEGRRVLTREPPAADLAYFYYPVYIDSLHIRVAPFEEGQPPEDGVAVEVLVKGLFSNGCLELHDLAQQRYGPLIDVTLRMRQPRQRLCTAVMRPYRHYFMLDGTYPPGAYTLQINDAIFPFEVRAPTAEE